MPALIAVFVIVVAILFGNRSQFNFSCHEDIITYYWRKGQDSNLRTFPSLVFKTSAFNHSATFPFAIIAYFLVDVDFGAGGGVDAEVTKNNHFIIGNHMSRM